MHRRARREVEAREILHRSAHPLTLPRIAQRIVLRLARAPLGVHHPAAHPDADERVVVLRQDLDPHAVVHTDQHLADRREDLHARHRVREHLDLQRGRKVRDLLSQAFRLPAPDVTARGSPGAGEGGPVAAERDPRGAGDERHRGQRLRRMSLERNSRSRGDAHRSVGGEALRRPREICRVAGAQRDIADEGAIHHADQGGVAQRPAIGREEREVRVHDREGDTGDALVIHREQRVSPGPARGAPLQPHLAPPRRVHRDRGGRTPRQSARGIDDLERRQERAAPRLDRAEQRPPAVRARRPGTAGEHEDLHEREQGERQRAAEPAAMQGRRAVRDRRQRVTQPLGRALREHAPALGDFQQARQLPSAEPLLLFDGACDGRGARTGRQPPPQAVREERGGDGRREPDDEGRDGREREPPPARQPHRARREGGERHDRRQQHAGQAGGARGPARLARDEIEDTHRPTPLVTAYTNRFTPIRSARSCAAGGSSG